MYLALKIVHLLSLAVALGMTVGNLVTMRYVSRLDVEARPPFGPLGRSFGAFGVMAVMLLWVTGIALYLLGGAALGGWFLVKLAAVVVLTGLVITVRTIGAKAIQAGTPPPVDTIWQLTVGILGAGVFTVAAAVIAFG